MKTYKFLTLLFLIPFILNAQKAKIDWGPEYKTKVQQFGMQLIGVDNGSFYMINDHGKKDKSILQYDLEKETFAEKEFTLEYNDEILEDPTFVRTKDKIIGLSAIVYKKDDVLQVVAFELKNGEFTEPKPIYEHDFRKYTKGIKYIVYVPKSNDDLDASVFQSQDSSKIVFTNVLSNQDTKKKDQVAIAVFDDQLNLLWDKIQEIPYKDKELDIQSVVVADNGKEVFAIGNFFTKKNRFDLKIFRITQDDLTEYDIVLNEKITPVALTTFYKEEEQSLVLGGLYSLKKEDYVHGVFSGILHLDSKSHEALDYSKFMAEERDNGSKDEYRMIGSFRLPNGNYQFLAQSTYLTSSGGGSGTISEVYYNYGDFIFTTIDPDGKIIKNQKIDRKYTSVYPRKGHVYFRNGDHTFLLYDSKISKEDKKKYKIKAMKIHSIGKLVGFDANGKTSRKKMLFISTDKSYFYFDIYPSVVENKLIFLGGQIANSGFEHWKNKRVIQFGTINLDNFK